ncbi:KUP/HAK/KT family potassium transporter [Bradyrhizobium sp. Tv2a-2]|nr:KUP/HAK/KT family potassium transporter [Bradyrhizobium sp. Tv2a-2]
MVALLTALGVIYGDVAASLLYGLKQAIAEGGGRA